MTKLAIVAAAGLGYYLYTHPELLDQFKHLLKNDGSVAVRNYTPQNGVCPEGYIISEDGTQCIPVSGNQCEDGYELSADGLSCNVIAQCEEGFVISADGTECISTENPCGDGFKLNDDNTECVYDGNPCGDNCYKINEATQQCDKIPGCGTATGAEWGDILLYTGESIVAGIIYDRVGNKISSAMERRAAQVAERQAAKKAAEASAKKLAEAAAKQIEKEAAALAAKKALQQEAAKAIQKVAMTKASETLGKKTAGIVAKQAAKEAGIIAGKKLAAKVATMVAKIGALSSTGIGALLTPLSLVALSLSVGLAASGTSFEKDSPSDWEWNDLPEGARVAIEALPGVGDVISIMMNFIAFKSGCPTGLVDQNGLCYEPPKPGFNCEAFLCTPSASTYGFNALSETPLHMTKRILTDTGTIPNRCPDGMVHGDESTDAAPGFCYQMPNYDGHGGHVVMGTSWERCPAGYTDTGARCEDVYGGGVGALKDCPPGWHDDGLTCREPISSSMNDCPAGSRDVAGTCWGKSKVCTWNAAHCNSWGRRECTSWGLLGESCIWNAAACNSWGRENCTETDVITKQLHERGLRTWGGAVKGRGAGSDLPCPAGKSEGYDGLCYDACREGYHRENLLCTRSFTKRSDVLAPHGNLCPDGKVEIAGLCYTDDAHMPQGYRRKVIGTLDQDCPADKEEWKGYHMFVKTQDIGAICQKASYTRPPFPKFSIYGMRKREPPPEPPEEPLPGLCSSLPPTPEGKVPTTLCRVSDPPAGFDMTADGMNFFKKCRDAFTFKMDTKECLFIDADGKTETYDNSEGFTQVEYTMV